MFCGISSPCLAQISGISFGIFPALVAIFYGRHLDMLKQEKHMYNIIKGQDLSLEQLKEMQKLFILIKLVFFLVINSLS